MIDRPILFSAQMVRALLAGSKTQTRRTLARLRKRGSVTEFGPSDTPGYDWHFRGREARWHDVRHSRLLQLCPYGQPGDLLWVREAWGIFNDEGFCDTSLRGIDAFPDGWIPAYRADHLDPVNGDGPDVPVWRPSIHMPRWASRITLLLTDVRVERLQDISEEDAVAEGIFFELNDDGGGRGWCWRHGEYYGSPAQAFRALWESIHGAGSWYENPYVWALTFRPIMANVDQVLADPSLRGVAA